jgi:hypothetical protein
MITKAVFLMLFATALGRNPDNTYDVAAERTIEGMVTRTAHSIGGVMYFTLKTTNGDVEVQLGPREFVEKSEFKLKIGEMVSVVGVPSMLREREVVLAREVRCNRGVFIIRDRNGGPMWEPDRPIQMDPDRVESVLC